MGRLRTFTLSVLPGYGVVAETAAAEDARERERKRLKKEEEARKKRVRKYKQRVAREGSSKADLI